MFQFHHQPFNYYANYAPGTPGRAHLQDEAMFTQLAASSDKACWLDHTQYDTTSILATIEQRFGIAPLSPRDAAAHSLSNVFDARQYEAAK